MRNILLLSLFLLVFNSHAQNSPKDWTVHNREVTFSEEVIHLNAQENDGILWLTTSDFQNGTIEIDIKGRDLLGQSFVGLAFHGQSNEQYDAVYFRPFNFQSPERNSHSVQYISMPGYDWATLRESEPGKYENTITPVVDPTSWFHVRLEIQYPKINAFINGAKEASLSIEQISSRSSGQVGLWVGNGSEGWFKNIKLSESGD
ncbi:family 16 glycoside hydrolase [Algoriphagus sp. D3-2-R+10]|uniref:family 16 glycoside hydrolase n=1 Tax=Algoriphagus aurantiacus TaxID=3103948 RepID=UPI002B3F1151|nr:family 16 glycoside hydrolase [Algoriphagus sp. D3-2-R+10]MEB2774320.1 family 16 glycoside hydrolase [Algoriphagus sp. D3-2-R+10]